MLRIFVLRCLACVLWVAFTFALGNAPAATATTRTLVGDHPLFSHHAAVLNGRHIGSAVALEGGFLVTAAHVLQGKRAGDVVRLVMPGNGRAVARARIVGISQEMDVALLSAGEGLLVPARLGNLPARQQPLWAAGVDASAGPYARRMATGRVDVRGVTEPRFGTGMIAAMQGAVPGFSGGPVFDRRGRLIGMLCGLRTSRGPQAAFILPIPAVLRAIEDIQGR